MPLSSVGWKLIGFGFKSVAPVAPIKLLEKFDRLYCNSKKE
jgi:hypothetical protein